MLVNLSDIFYDDRFNSRGFIAPVTVEDLAKSIAASGLIQPVIVRTWTGPPYHLVCGHRRYLACKSLGHTQIKVEVRENLSDRDARILNLQENMEREDLTPSQELDAILALYGDKPNTAEVAKQLGRSRKWVAERLAIRKLLPEVRREVDAGFLTAYDITCLLVAPEDQQFSLAQRLKAAHMSGKSSSSVIASVTGAKRRVKTKATIQRMISDLMDKGFEPRGYRCLAWAAGTITDEELLDPTQRRNKRGRPRKGQ